MVILQIEFFDILPQRYGDILIPSMEEGMLVAGGGEKEYGLRSVPARFSSTSGFRVELDLPGGPKARVVMLFLPCRTVACQHVRDEGEEVAEAPALATSQFVPAQDTKQGVPWAFACEQNPATAKGALVAGRARSKCRPVLLCYCMAEQNAGRRYGAVVRSNEQRFSVHWPHGYGRKPFKRPATRCAWSQADCPCNGLQQSLWLYKGVLQSL